MKLTPPQLLKSLGLKITTARVEIINILSQSGIPLDAEKITKALKIKKISINQATVYRTLTSLVEGGLIKTVDLKKDSIFYELSAKHHHHHIVCTSCNTMEDFNNQEIENLLEKVIKKSPKFNKVNEHSLELFGVCVKCS